LSKVPYINIRCYLYRQYRNEYSKYHLSDFDKAIDTIFPAIEKLFFAMLTSQYPLDKLDKYLETHLKSLNNHNYTSNALFDPTCGLFNFQDSNTPHISFYRDEKKTDLPTLFIRFVKKFPYLTDESSFYNYNKLNGNAGAIPYENIPFTIHNRKDFWTFMNMYLKLPPDQEGSESSSEISNRYELLLSVTEILNNIIGHD